MGAEADEEKGAGQAVVWGGGGRVKGLEWAGQLVRVGGSQFQL